jgi:TctA family transporter
MRPEGRWSRKTVPVPPGDRHQSDAAAERPLRVLNLPLVGVWVKLIRIPYRMLFPAIVGLCCIGAYTVNSNLFDLYVMAFFAVFGYVCLKLDCEPAPLILGFVLGPLMEETSGGRPSFREVI